MFGFIIKAGAATTANDAPPQLSDLEGIFANIVGNVIMPLAAIVVFIMLSWGGVKYIMSGGDPKKAESAKNTLTFAVGGIVLVALSYLILLIIAEFTGQRGILNFRISL